MCCLPLQSMFSNRKTAKNDRILKLVTGLTSLMLQIRVSVTPPPPPTPHSLLSAHYSFPIQTLKLEKTSLQSTSYTHEHAKMHQFIAFSKNISNEERGVHGEVCIGV